MNNYEIHFGGFTHWCHAETPLRACLLTLYECINQWKTFPQLPFRVHDLNTGDNHHVGLAEVIALRYNSVNEPPPFPSEQAQLDSEIEWFEEVAQPLAA